MCAAGRGSPHDTHLRPARVGSVIEIIIIDGEKTAHVQGMKICQLPESGSSGSAPPGLRMNEDERVTV